jgi:GBP family porin
MKKTLLAAALLAGFAGAASAQSSVTLYGVLDIGIAYQNVSYTTPAGNDVSASRFGMNNGVQSGNRWGLKGVEDLGGGNQVIFNLENGFNLGNGMTAQDGREFGRQAWLGLQNAAWGNVKAGRQVAVAYDYVGNSGIDPFYMGMAQAQMGNSFTTVTNVRYDNLLKYETPAMSGFQASLGYSFATGMAGYYANGAGITTSAASAAADYNFATQNNSTAITFGAKYANGPVYIAASYDQVNSNPNLIPGNATPANPKAWILGGAYDFQVVKVSAAYGQSRGGVIGAGSQLAKTVSGSAVTDAGAFNTSGAYSLFADGVGFNSYLVGLSAPIGGSSKVFASWQMATPNGNLQSANTKNIDVNNQNIYSIGYQYDFSKRTNLYSYLSYANNYGFIDTAKSTIVGVGVRHMF